MNGFSGDATAEFFNSDFTGRKFFYGHRYTVGNKSKLRSVSLFSTDAW
jgi:hypothetical protein